MNYFPTVKDSALRHNLEVAFQHIIDLLAISEDQIYKNKPLFVSSFRKTIIIHTASIIEAMLLWKLKKIVEEKNVELSEEWIYFDIKKLCDKDKGVEVIAGFRRKEKKVLEKLDFMRISDICLKHNLIDSDLKIEIDQVRKLRNRLHIGSLNEIEKLYTRSDLDLCFKVAGKVRKLIT